MKCKKCGHEAPAISSKPDEKEFIAGIPFWWIEEVPKEQFENTITAIFICPKCGEVQ